MKKFMNLTLLLAGWALLASATGCSSSDDGVAVQGVRLSETSLSLITGETARLTATVSPENATNTAVTWLSSNPSVAAVESGTVTAIAEGAATITVTTADGGKTATCLVSVSDIHVESIAIAPAEDLVLAKGETARLTAAVTPSDAKDQTFSWSSSDEAVAAVDADGLVTAVSGGEADITATSHDGGKTASVHVKVLVHAAGVSLNETEITVYAGIPYTGLAAAFAPEDCTETGFSLSSSDENIVTASVEDGAITVLGMAEGTAVVTLTATDGAFTAQVTVTVLPTGTQMDEDDYGKYE